MRASCGTTSLRMNSAAVRPNKRCSSVRSSRVKMSSGPMLWVRNCPPAAVCWVDTYVRRKYKPAHVPTINQLFDLTGRVAIVTGGSRGLGQEMAEGLAEAGAKLMLCARREEWLTPTVAGMRSHGFAVEAATCDVSDKDQVQRVVDRTMETFGRIDILVNNAGLSWGESPEAMPLD